MTERFDGSLNDAESDRLSPTCELPPSTRRPLRVLLVGDRQDVLDTIKNLHQRGFAPAGEWSRAVACPTTDEVMQRVVV
ncbi:MAG: hypothetical protein HC881_19340, partial [Leptolyngbyaceae cyanobacterium SL_7_1]|nr:hypothetical protein [Leptolyngbyaceae cyanobacterium SL_7_1]